MRLPAFDSRTLSRSSFSREERTGARYANPFGGFFAFGSHRLDDMMFTLFSSH